MEEKTDDMASFQETSLLLGRYLKSRENDEETVIGEWLKLKRPSGVPSGQVHTNTHIFINQPFLLALIGKEKKK